LSKTKRGKSDKDREKGDSAITSNVDKGIADSGSANASIEQGETSRGNACERQEKRENTLDSELRMMLSLNERGWLKYKLVPTERRAPVSAKTKTGASRCVC
jgi:hypothetical protein